MRWRSLLHVVVALLFTGCVHGYATPFQPAPVLTGAGMWIAVGASAFALGIAYVAVLRADHFHDRLHAFAVALAVAGICTPLLAVFIAFVAMKSLPSLYTAAAGTPVVEPITGRIEVDPGYPFCSHYVISDELTAVPTKNCMGPEAHEIAPGQVVALDVHGRRSVLGLRIERIALRPVSR